jgi:hypothetical protein
MKIFVSHSTGFDYHQKLFQPIRNCDALSRFSVYLPHEVREKPQHTLQVIRTSGVVLAEVSYSLTGSGIELGWANSAGTCRISDHHNP